MKYLFFIFIFFRINPLFAQVEYNKRPLAAAARPLPFVHTIPQLHADCIDPLCKMKVAKGAKMAVLYHGKEYGFCSDYCRSLFKGNPSFYLKEYILTGKSIPHTRRIQ